MHRVPKITHVKFAYDSYGMKTVSLNMDFRFDGNKSYSVQKNSLKSFYRVY